jgi:anti-sigma factor RsiW
MTTCRSIRSRFSAYLDGDITGVAMQAMAVHLESCAECAAEFEQWREMQRSLTSLGSARVPEDLGLRIRVALSQERARTARNTLANWKVRWDNTFAPFLLQASAGLASAIVLVGTMAVLIGAFAIPEPAAARDAQSSMASAPRFLYSSVEADAGTVTRRGRPVTVEVFVDPQGRVYDYDIISGPTDAATRADLESLLLTSVFQPATSYGQPVKGVALLSFSGVSVQG